MIEKKKVQKKLTLEVCFEKKRDLEMDLLKLLKCKLNLFLGWLELILKPGSYYQYKYIIERIEIKEKQGKLFSIVYYKLIGCRKLLMESASELNKLSIFTLFRPDHAQMIVSIATAEALLMGQSINDISYKYEKYVSYCNLKLNGKK